MRISSTLLGRVSALTIPLLMVSGCAGSGSGSSSSSASPSPLDRQSVLAAVGCTSAEQFTPYKPAATAYQCKSPRGSVTFYDSPGDQEVMIKTVYVTFPQLHVVAGEGWTASSDEPGSALLTSAVDLGGKVVQ